MTNELFSAFQDVSAAGADAKRIAVREYDPAAATGKHQFVLFLKPEATDIGNGVNLDKVLELLTERLSAFDVEIGAALALNGPYLAAHRLMDQHYGVINAISKGGYDAISEGAGAKLAADFGELIDAGAPVLGGHQFIDANPEFSPLALSTINDNIGTSKLAGGTYVLKIDLLGQPQLILNPFHPYQLVPFTAPGKGIVVIEGISSTPWADLRGKLAGTTNPLNAAEGSIRQRFLAHQSDLGLAAVNQGANGVHLSAGPLEGMVEVQRFFSEHESGNQLAWSDTSFGQLLKSKGASADRVAELAGNPDIGGESAFDLTEEIDAEDSAAKLV